MQKNATRRLEIRSENNRKLHFFGAFDAQCLGRTSHKLRFVSNRSLQLAKKSEHNTQAVLA